MGSAIAHLGQMTDSLDTAAKSLRVLANGGVSLKEIVLPINDRSARDNLVAFYKAGCPAFIALPAKMRNPKPSMVLMRTIELPACDSSPTHDYHSGDVSSWRSLDLERWLTPFQPACKAAEISVFKRSKSQTFATMFRELLKLDVATPLKTIEDRLKAGGHVVALQHVESLVEKQERGEDVGLRADARGNFAPFLDKDGRVCVLSVGLIGCWNRDIKDLDDASPQLPQARLIIGNAEALNL